MAENETPTPAPQGMRLSEALTPRTAPAAPRGQWDEIGQGLMSALVANVQKQVGASAGGADEMDRLMKYMMVMKMMKEMRDEPEAPADKGMASVLAALIKGNGDQMTQLLTLLLKNQTAAPDPVAANQAAQQQFLQVLEIARSIAGGGHDDNGDLLKQIGLSTIQGALNSDPLESALKTHERIKAITGEGSNVIDFDVWKAKEEFALKREQLQLEAKRDAASRDSSNQLMQGFAAVLRPGPGPAAAPAGGGTPPGGLVRYT